MQKKLAQMFILLILHTIALSSAKVKIFKKKDKPFQIMGKVIVYITGCLLTIVICFFLFLFASEWVWPEFNGSYSLGNNIYMI